MFDFYREIDGMQGNTRWTSYICFVKVAKFTHTNFNHVQCIHLVIGAPVLAVLASTIVEAQNS